MFISRLLGFIYIFFSLAKLFGQRSQYIRIKILLENPYMYVLITETVYCSRLYGNHIYLLVLTQLEPPVQNTIASRQNGNRKSLCERPSWRGRLLIRTKNTSFVLSGLDIFNECQSQNFKLSQICFIGQYYFFDNILLRLYQPQLFY